jgi:hypothetical protein
VPLQRGERGQVGEAGDAARGDDRPIRRGKHRCEGVERGAFEHAVAGDLGVDEAA